MTANNVSEENLKYCLISAIVLMARWLCCDVSHVSIQIESHKCNFISFSHSFFSLPFYFNFYFLWVCMATAIAFTEKLGTPLVEQMTGC